MTRFLFSCLFLSIVFASACGDDPPAAASDAGADLGTMPVDMGRADLGVRDLGVTDLGTMADASVRVCEPSGECGVLAGTSCESTERCSFDDFGGTGEITSQCETLRTMGVEGAVCSARTDCGSGMYCSFTTRVCTRMCCPENGNADCTGGQQCTTLFGSDSMFSIRGCVTVDTCDLAMQTGCDEGETCVLTDPGASNRTCGPSGTVVEGEACDRLSAACAEGLDCIPVLVGEAFEYRCVKYCDTVTGLPCLTSGACMTTEAVPVPQVGICGTTK